MASEALLEIGCEELPASFVEPALAALKLAVVSGLEARRLPHGKVETFGTPRRLVVTLADVAGGSADLEREVTGPPVRAGFDKDGQPTRAAQKFAESAGVTVEQLLRVETPKGEYLAAKVTDAGRPALALLAEVFSEAVHGLEFRKSMRWGDVELTFARPVQWIVALLDEEVVPVVMGDVRSGRVTRAHRFLTPEPITLDAAKAWASAMEQGHVIADVEARRALLEQRVQDAAARAGGTLLEDRELLNQVTHLVELPNPVIGSFDPRHLDLPPEVLVQEMRGHQRYFSVVDAQGKLLPKFIAVSNTPVRDEGLSLRGYERVLEARLSDGRFFFDEDRRQPLESRVDALSRVVWQGKLGTYAEKSERIAALAGWLCAQVGKGDPAHVARAAKLAKADLVTGMVGEFPELQGVMGREYARADGEPEAVALAIHEHYLPKSAQDALPTADEGALVGLADRLDTLVGIFGIGQGPSGAADPFALRRACLAVIHLILGRGYRLDLPAAIAESRRLLAPKLEGVKRKAGAPDVEAEVLEFFRGRLKADWADEARADVIESVLSAGFGDLVDAHQRLIALAPRVGSPGFAPLAGTFKRVANIVAKQAKDVAPGEVDPSILEDGAERDLAEAVEAVSGRFNAQLEQGAHGPALDEVSALKPAVDRFFDDVMVMAEDRAMRENRVRLLIRIGAMFGRVADFSKLQVE